MQGIIHSEWKSWHNSSNTTILIQSILLPCVYSIEYVEHNAKLDPTLKPSNYK